MIVDFFSTCLPLLGSLNSLLYTEFNTTQGIQILTNFCQLQSALNVAEGQPGHYDFAILITG